MKNLYNIGIGILYLIGVSSCSTDNIDIYNGGNQVYFERVASQADSLTFSFAVYDEEITSSIVEIPIISTGNICNHDREIKFEIKKESSAIEGKDYTIEKVIIPAGKYKTTMKVTLFRQSELKEHEKIILFQMLPTSELNIDVDPKWTDYKLKINDILTKPTRWIYECQPYFGTYSDVKYKFIIDTLGIWDFPDSGDNAIPESQMYYYQDKMKSALAEWEKENGPMYDEKGNKVTFD